MGPRRTLLYCVVITLLLHVVTYLLNTQLPLQILALGGRKAHIGWLFAAITGVAMILRPQVGGWTDRYGGRTVMLPGAVTLLVTMVAFFFATTPVALIGLMIGLGIANALLSTTGSIVVANASAPERRGEALSMYYVASSAGVATGPALGFALSAVGGMKLNLTVVMALSLVAAACVFALQAPPGKGAVAGSGFGPLWSRHAVAASLVLMIITAGHSTVYAFLPLHSSAVGLGNAAWFFPLMSGCTIASRLVLRRASDQFGRVRVLVPALVALVLGQRGAGGLAIDRIADPRRHAARHRQLDALSHARRPRGRSHAGHRARAGDRDPVGRVGRRRLRRRATHRAARRGARLLRGVPGLRAHGGGRAGRVPAQRAWPAGRAGTRRARGLTRS